mgnify:CR=1 FL=1
MLVKVPLARLAVEKLRSAGITAAVALLLAIYVVLSVGASLHKGLSYDEGEQLAVGYNIWTNGDFRMEGADGDLIKRWATLPYLISHPHAAPNTNDFWRNAAAYVFGYEFFFQSNNTPAWLLLQGRAMAVLIGAMTGLLVFYCSRELFGNLGGIFSLLLFVFSVNMLAFGALVSTDMSACLMLLGSTWCVWRLLHRVTWGRLALSLVFASLLLLAKLSGAAIFPITLILILIKLFSGRPLEWQLWRKRVITSSVGQIGVFTGLLALHVLCAWVALWAHYDFRFSAKANAADQNLLFTHYARTDAVDERVADFLDWVHDEHLLPEGFLQGVHTLLTTNESRGSFLDGQWNVEGNSDFFLKAFWYKTPPAILLLLCISLTGLVRGWRAGQMSATTEGMAIGEVNSQSKLLYESMPYLVLIVVYLLIAVVQQVNIGHRLILPIYPPLFILIGGMVALIWFRAHWLMRGLVLLILVWMPVEAMWIYPNYLAYFSPLVGGQEQGYRLLVDSSLDWGMDVPALKQWLEVNNPGNKV